MIKLDGWITIGTKLDTNQFDKQISDLENKIDSEEKKQELLNNKTKEYQKELSEATYKVKELAEEYNNATQKAEDLQNIIKDTKPGSYQNYMATAEFEEQSKIVEELYQKLSKAESKQAGVQNKVTQTNIQYEKSVKAVDRLRGKIELINLKRQKKEFDGLQKSVNSFSKGITNTIAKIGKMALAVFGVRSAYMALRRASSTLAQYNEQYAQDLEYIRFALAQGLAPILEKIVLLAQTLMAYINYLSNAWFGKQIFASAKDFEKMQKSAGGVAKSTKEIKNNLAGFDELNVLDSSKQGEGGGFVAPSIDFGNIENIEIPEWLVKIKDILQPVVDFFDDINEKYGPVATGIALVVGALAGFFILKGLINLFKGFGKAMTGFSADFTGFFNSLGTATEIIAILGGLTLVIQAITDLIDTFSESGLSLGEVAGLLGIVLGEVAVAFGVLLGTLTALNPSWQSIAGAVVIFAGLAVVLLTVSNLIKTFAQSGVSLNEVIGLMSTILISLVATMGAVALLGPAMTAGLVPFVAVVAGISALLVVMAYTLPTILDAVQKFINNIAPALSIIIESIANGISVIINSIGTVLPPIIDSIGNLFNTIFSGIANIIETVADTIIRLQESTIEFINQLGPAINKFVDGIIEAVTKLINFVISAIEYMVNLIISGINKIIDGINAVGDYIGFTIDRVPDFELPRFTPKLARGGVVTKPTQAVIGEAGREAVMPLDNNTEWMDILAEKLSQRETNGGQQLTIRFEGSMAQLVRELKPQFEIENKRVGTRIITAGGAY